MWRDKGECINKRKSVNKKRKLEITNEALAFFYPYTLFTFNIYNYFISLYLYILTILRTSSAILKVLL